MARQKGIIPLIGAIGWINFTSEKVCQQHEQKVKDFMELVLGVIRFDFERLIHNTEWVKPMLNDRHFTDTNFSISIGSVPEDTVQLIANLRVVFYQDVNGIPYL